MSKFLLIASVFFILMTAQAEEGIHFIGGFEPNPVTLDERIKLAKGCFDKHLDPVVKELSELSSDDRAMYAADSLGQLFLHEVVEGFSHTYTGIYDQFIGGDVDATDSIKIAHSMSYFREKLTALKAKGVLPEKLACIANCIGYRMIPGNMSVPTSATMTEAIAGGYGYCRHHAVFINNLLGSGIASDVDYEVGMSGVHIYSQVTFDSGETYIIDPGNLYGVEGCVLINPNPLVSGLRKVRDRNRELTRIIDETSGSGTPSTSGAGGSTSN